MSLFWRIKEWLGLVEAPPRLSPEEAKAAFHRQYRNFRALLTANNNALELMAEIEQALSGSRPFSMAFVRGHCTALVANVQKMVNYLQILSGNRYRSLQPPLQRLSEELEEILNREPPLAGRELVLPLARLDRHRADEAGEKMANLGEIRNRVGFATPDGFVTPAAAPRHFFAANNLQMEINRRLRGLDPERLAEIYAASAAIERLIVQAPLPADLEMEILQNYARLRGERTELLVALRSSALGEDSSHASFAGMYRSRLKVDAASLLKTYKEIVAGKYRPRAMVYRLQRGFRHQDVIMCVGCLAMVEAEVSGVAFSRPPGDLRGEWVEISAAAGLADGVVSGRVPAVRFRVERRRPWRCLEANRLLTSEQLAGLAQMAVRLEEHFGAPQDIEWSLAAGRIYLLQSRPLGGAGRSGAAEVSVQQVGAPAAVVDEDDAPLRGGVTVAAGVAAGPVFVVEREEELLAFPKGAVLVVAQALPEWAVVLPRAAAVLAETGQSAAHLATVAREFGIPALFGLAGLRRMLVAGEEITVDATGRRIYRGRRPELLTQAPPPPRLMLGSPVYRVLKEAAALITPLNLLDPASAFFRPGSCRTLHDITRFCHEKAVAAMFAFGDRLGFVAGAARRLVGESPYTWWIIDLEDGFTPDIDPKTSYVTLEQIVSAPMLAVWQGMTAFPWAGPPPVNLKGFGAILFRSTMNPDLEPAVRSRLSERSYFLIARSFCNLSLRLGYHFALLESHVSELLTENYVSFQFKGGAADDRRRCLRIELIAEVLRRYDFRVEIKDDTLTARLEKMEAPFLLERLKILGYLLIHTRQIDMVMGDSGMVAHYRRKIAADLETIMTAAVARAARHENQTHG